MSQRRPPADGGINELLSKHVDGCLTDEGYDRLREILAEKGKRYEEYVDFYVAHAALEARCALAPSDVDLQESIQAYSRDLITAPPAPRGGRESRGRLIALAAAMAVAACLVLWFAVPGGVGGRGDDGAWSHVGVLLKAEGARWAGPSFKAPSQLSIGDKLDLVEGTVEVSLDRGVIVAMRSPAQLEFLSPMRVRATRGAVRARVGPDATGFVIETPSASVTDLGTEFGVLVGDGGATDVVVFDGEVDLDVRSDHGADRNRKRSATRPPAGPTKRLKTGEGLRVDTRGVLSRIVSIHSDSYPLLEGRLPRGVAAREPLIRRVTDNLRAPEASEYYQIVRQGLGDDARVYVDRFHEWNGLDERGLPEFLVGADYVLTFNSDKKQQDLQIEVELTRPVVLYVLLDDRVPTPAWLGSDFTDTGVDIGIDEGWRDTNGELYSQAKKAPVNPKNPNSKLVCRLAVGPGRSIDTVFSVWAREVRAAGSVVLGSLENDEHLVGMYAIAATPLPVEVSL